MSIEQDWQDISTAPRDGTFVMLANPGWPNDVEGFWHQGSQAWSPNKTMSGLGNRVIGVEAPTHWKPLTSDQSQY